MPSSAIRGFAFEEFNEIDRTDDIVEESLRRRNWSEERIKKCTARLSDLMCAFPCMDGNQTNHASAERKKDSFNVYDMQARMSVGASNTWPLCHSTKGVV